MKAQIIPLTIKGKFIMPFIITTDTSCDAFKNDLDAKNIPWIPLTYTIDGISNEDNFTKDAQYQAFYDKVKAGAMPTTSQINQFNHEEFFNKVLDGGAKEIVHLTLSSGLSETYNAAVLAANAIMEQRNSVKVYIVDTLSATQGHMAILDYGVELRDSGMSGADAAAKIAEFTQKVMHFFMVDDLHHLKRGGRVSAASALIGSLLKIKPILTINNEGKLAVIKKAKGSAAAIKFFFEMIETYKEDKNGGTFYIVNGNAHDSVASLKEQLNEKYPSIAIKSGWVGPVIGAHTGSGIFGVAFLAKQRLIDK